MEGRTAELPTAPFDTLGHYAVQPYNGTAVRKNGNHF
jgi:hypothetical protein